MSFRSIAILIFISALSPSFVNADFLQNGFGLSDPDQTIRFDELGLADFTPITDQYAGLGVTFSPTLFQSPQDFNAPNIDFDTVGNFDFNEFINPFSIHFEEDVSAAAFAMITNLGTSEFTALLDGVEIESFATVTDTINPENFYGFEGIVFDEIQVNVGGSQNAMLMDNLQFNTAAIPEPGLGLVCVLTAAGISLGRRRK